jgi:molybdate transport system permease protein
MTADWSPLWAALRVAAASVSVALVPGAWLGWALARREFRGKTAVEAVVLLPLAMPPLILGAYFLFALAGQPARFTWLVASAAGFATALPAITGAASAGFASLGCDFDKAAQSLGAPGWRVFWVVEMPLGVRATLPAALVAFPRLAAEYAVVMLVAASSAVRDGLLHGPLLPAIGVCALAAIVTGARMRRLRGRA